MRLVTLVAEITLSLLDNLFCLISLLTPKSADIWIFGAMFGRKYVDNSKYFYEFVARTHPEIRPVWITGSRAVVAALRRCGAEAYLFYSPRGVWLSLRAGVAFVSHSVARDIRPFVLTRGTLLVNLWHGIPLKKIARDDDVSDIRNKDVFKALSFLARTLCPGLRRSADLTIACSAEDRRSFSSAFGVPEAAIAITGYPRNDAIFTGGSRPAELSGKIIGIYMPTFRGQDGEHCDFFERYGFDAERFNARLAKMNVHLYLKLHHFNLPQGKMLRTIESLSSVSFYDKADVYSDMAHFDFLITDYSSIYFDFLLTGKPIIFAPFDLTEYAVAERKFYYDYDEVTPGPKGRNWDEIGSLIQKVVSAPDACHEERNRMKDRFFKYQDGASSIRVFAAVEDLLRRRA